jgi:hypothetical protein
VNLTQNKYKQNANYSTPDILFLSKDLLRPEFYKLAHDFLLDKYYSKKLYECWGLSQLYKEMSKLSCASPFVDGVTTDKISHH